MPHYMFYAPNLTSKEIGGGPVMGRYPYLVNPGPHAYIILTVGETEKAQINRESQELAKELCTYRSYFARMGLRRITRLTDMPARVEVRLTESLSTTMNHQPMMRHRRLFSNVLSEQILALVLGLRFCGPGGLMVDSTADAEDDSPDGSSRFIKKFKPLGIRLGSALAGCFNVRQELVECTSGPAGILATIKMTFAPSNEKDHEPIRSFLWLIQPGEYERTQGASWTELINTQETVSRQIPALRIGPGKSWTFRLGHNRLIQKAADRVADVLNGGDDRGVIFASYAQAARTNLLPSKCRGNMR